MSSQVVVILVLVAAFLLLTANAARRNRTTDAHYIASGRVPWWLNGLAITGEYASAASFLGITGGIALAGYNGFYLAIGVPLGLLVLLLLVAEPMRRHGKYTLSDMLAERFDQPTVRTMVALTTIALTIMYMIAQFVGAGLLLELLFGIDYALSVAIIGVLMALIVAIGGMTAATHVQALKTVLMFLATITLLVLVLSRIGWNPLDIMDQAIQRYGPEAVSSPAPSSFAERLDLLSVPLALALGSAGLPHILIRFLTVRDGRSARQSALLVCWLMAGYLTLILVVAYGAAVLVGRQAISDQSSAGTLAALQLSAVVGGDLLQSLMAGVVFAIILAVLAGLTVAASGAISHDLYANVLKSGEVSQRRQLVAARVGALVVAAAGLALALAFSSVNLAFLGALAFGLAASTTLPVIVFTLYWRRFNVVGIASALITGLVTTLVTLLLGPNIMGEAALFPLAQPLPVTLPLAVLAAIIGTLATTPRPTDERPHEITVH